MVRLVLLCLLLAGCAPEPRKMDWQAVVEDVENAAR